MAINNLPKVGLRGGFSDRMGIQVINTEVQTDDLDDRTRVSLINLINAVYNKVFVGVNYTDKKNIFLKDVLSNVYLQEVGHWEGYCDDYYVFKEFINETIYKDTYDSVLTVVEYIVQKLEYHYLEIYHMRFDIESLFITFPTSETI